MVTLMNEPDCINHRQKTIHVSLQQHFIIDLLPNYSADLEAISPKRDETEIATSFLTLAYRLKCG
jgi:hypothetical protein